MSSKPKFRVIFAKPQESLVSEIDDYFRVWLEGGELLELTPEQVKDLLKIVDDALTYRGLKSRAQVELINGLRDRARVLRDAGKIRSW